ncbi:DUF1707 domain-containing protein [Streptomyces sioyaensis]|uniref:DUF1707 SHOCT-like domain-containing protein n=1 Tax=Streptomyces sioyaensis TaxID=67364 RepID=UPI0037B052FC
MTNAEQPAARMTPEYVVDPRAGDTDRDAVAERLRVAAGEGRIDLTELDERLDRAYHAKTYRELDVLVADLGKPLSGADPGAEALVLKTRLSSIEQGGRWIVPRRIVAECKMLHITIDFTEATCVHRDVTVEALCGSGSIRLIVPRSWAVRVDASSTNTAHIINKATEQADSTGPTVTVIGHPRSGRIKIKQVRRG